MTQSSNHPWHQSLPQLLEGLISHDAPDCDIEFVTLDSRQVKEGALFLATAGIKRHGLEFIQQAWANGAAAVVYEPGKGVVAPFAPQGKICLPVERLGMHASQIAARFFEHPSHAMRVCGITGTNGKTTTTHLLSTALRFVGNRCGQMGTIGFGLNEPLSTSALTTPDAVAVQQRLAWIREQRATHLAMEVSSHALDQHRVEAVAFDCAVFTNLSRDHLDYHKDLEHYGQTKSRLFSGFAITHGIINADDAFGRTLIDKVKDQVPLTSIGTQKQAIAGVERHVYASHIVTHPRGLSVQIDGAFGKAQIESPLLGKFNAQNLLCALGVMLQWGVPLAQAASSLSSVCPPPGRMETFGREDDARIIVDFAHTPEALQNAVDALRAHCSGKLWVVFGCGGDRDRGKRPQMAQAASHADVVIVTNDNPRHEDQRSIIEQILRGFAKDAQVTVEPDRAAAITRAVHQAGPGDIVLIAGKGHEDYQIVGAQKIPMSDREIVKHLLQEHSHG